MKNRQVWLKKIDKDCPMLLRMLRNGHGVDVTLKLGFKPWKRNGPPTKERYIEYAKINKS